MGRPVVPIRNLQRRIPEAGRIRIGVRSGKAMRALDVFRFTSPDREAIDQIAATYGGEVKPWTDAKAAPGQFEVITTANELRIVLPSDPLGSSPTYEMWSGGGRARSCDGITCTTLEPGPDGPEPCEQECICAAAGSLSCEPHTRLNVLLPEVRFTGVWRLESKSWNVAHEMPDFVALIQSLQQQGLTRGVLRLEHRVSKAAGQTRRFVVPVLGVSESLDALAAGAARVGAIGAGSSAAVAEIGSGVGHTEMTAPVGSPSDRPASAIPDPDDEVVDAELVEEVDDRSLADVLPSDVNESRALAIARRLGSTATSCDEVRGYELIARVLDALSVAEVAP